MDNADKRCAVVLSGPSGRGAHLFWGSPGASPRKFCSWGSKNFNVISLKNNGFKFFS